MKLKISIISTCLLLAGANALDMNNIFSKGKEIMGESSSNSANSDLQTRGLKKALNIGVESAVKSLSDYGYLNNSDVKIPLPKGLQSVANIAKKAGASKYVNDLERDMNLAAGEAVKKATPIFTKAITDMNVQDAAKLVKGGNNSITNYFKGKTEKQLVSMMKPIVKKTTANNSLASSYKALMNTTKSSGLLNQANTIANSFGVDVGGVEDLDNYVTQKAVDGVFYMIGKEEEKIRKNPLGYGSDLIKKVFKY